MTIPKNGEIWWADLDPTVGHEQAGHRPVLIVSADGFNRIATQLVIVCPLTSKPHGYPSHIPTIATPPLPKPSWTMAEMVRSISTERLTRRITAADAPTMQAVGKALKILLDLSGSDNP